MKDMSEVAEELTREQAEQINPLIGSGHRDTLNNVSAVLGLLQDLAATNEQDLEHVRTIGVFRLLEPVIAAINYESEVPKK